MCLTGTLIIHTCACTFLNSLSFFLVGCVCVSVCLCVWCKLLTLWSFGSVYKDINLKKPTYVYEKPLDFVSFSHLWFAMPVCVTWQPLQLDYG